MKPDPSGLDPHNIVSEADVIDVHCRQWWGMILRDEYECHYCSYTMTISQGKIPKLTFTVLNVFSYSRTISQVEISKLTFTVLNVVSYP